MTAFSSAAVRPHSVRKLASGDSVLVPRYRRSRTG